MFFFHIHHGKTKLFRSLIWHFVHITHTLKMENKRRNASDAAFKLNGIDLAVTEGCCTSSRH